MPALRKKAGANLKWGMECFFAQHADHAAHAFKTHLESYGAHKQWEMFVLCFVGILEATTNSEVVWVAQSLFFCFKGSSAMYQIF